MLVKLNGEDGLRQGTRELIADRSLDWLKIPVDELKWEQIPNYYRINGRAVVILALREMPYTEYLQTSHWQDVRRMCFATHGWRCKVCDCLGPMHVHHLTYEHRGCEFPEEVIPLCPEHHKAEHAITTHKMHAEFERLFGDKS